MLKLIHGDDKRSLGRTENLAPDEERCAGEEETVEEDAARVAMKVPEARMLLQRLKIAR